MKLVALALSCAALAACEKATPKAPFDAEETKLLRDLPGTNVALLGGNLLRMQSFLDTAMGKLSQDVENDFVADTAAYKTWSECFSGKGHIRIAGGIVLFPRVELRMVIAGKTIDDITRCAAQAHYATTADPDHKYVALTLTERGGQALTTGYLLLPDGNLLMDLVLQPGAATPLVPTTRADLEALVAGLSRASAVDDKRLIELAAKADHTKTFWFAGSGTGTPLASHLGDFYGAFDVTANAMAADATVTFTDGSTAATIEDVYKKAHALGAAAPAGMKMLADSTRIERTDSTIHAELTMTIDQLQMLRASMPH
jgi:hypothetical protein